MPRALARRRRDLFCARAPPRPQFEILLGERKEADWGDGTGQRIFGELALLYNQPRAASVRAVSDAVVWAIGRAAFRAALARGVRAQHERLRAALQRGILAELAPATREALTSAASVVHFRAGELIVRRGEPGEVFFIILTGSVLCKGLSGDQSNNLLTAGDYFGERALLRTGEHSVRAADVEAMTAVSLIALHRRDFDAHLAPLRELLEYNIGIRLLLCTPLPGHLLTSLRRRLDVVHPLAGAGAVAVFNVGLCVLATAMLVGKSYNPFLYFRF